MFSPRLFRPAPRLSRFTTSNLHNSPFRKIFAASFRSQASLHQRFQYQNIQRTRNLFYRWANRPTFYYEIGGFSVLVAGVYTLNLETVPVTGRKRFNVVSPELEKTVGESGYKQILQEYRGRILSDNDSRTRLVRRVLEQLIPQSGLQDQDWEVYVVEQAEPNAFVLPGGKVFVHTGILPICKTEDGVAAVLGHEIAHNVAHHMAERLSKEGVITFLMVATMLVLGIYDSSTGLLFDWVMRKPASRLQEAEADEIGLMMMAQSCYNPEAAVEMWHRMGEQEKVKVPQFMSTHPGSENREETLRNLLPRAMDAYQDSGCGTLSQQYASFQNMNAQKSTSWP